MDRRRINRVSGIVPIFLSLTACGLVIFAVATGAEIHNSDEGTLAHIFQLLIVAEVPFVLIFVATADWTRIASAARLIALQGLALLLAFAPVAYFKL